jgi:enoyl-CoA hydratase
MGTVRREQEGAVARLVFENPPRNALTTAMFEELGRHVREIERDASVRVVVVHGAGPQLYTVGADIREMDVQAALTDRQATTRAWLQPIHDVLDAIAGSSKVYLCAMKGIAYGGGLEIAAACDIRLAAEDARFAMPEVKLGIIPGYGGTQRLPRLVGKGIAMQLLLTGEMITAQEAHRIGLVNEVTAPADLIPRAEAIAQKVIANGPRAVQYTMEAVNKGMETTLPEGLYMEAVLFGMASATEDKKEGTAAFLEKRPAQFKGK